MSQVVRVNATDRRIKHFGPWNEGDGTMLVLSGHTNFFFMFRGSIYA